MLVTSQGHVNNARLYMEDMLTRWDKRSVLPFIANSMWEPFGKIDGIQVITFIRIAECHQAWLHILVWALLAMPGWHVLGECFKLKLQGFCAEVLIIVKDEMLCMEHNWLAMCVLDFRS